MSDVFLSPLSLAALHALAGGDLAAAERETGRALPAGLLDRRDLWIMRRDQLAEDPAAAPWLVRLVVTEPDGLVVGHAGFHGPPSSDGMVEIGYMIQPAHRRRGHARAAALGLIAFARAHGARTVRASISPDNVPSLALAASLGFVRVGEQWDEVDGRELVFERPA